MVLTASNAYTGVTTISAGTLQLGNGGGGSLATISSASTIVNNGTLAFNNVAGLTQGTNFSAAAISGGGNVVLNGGLLTLAGVANSYNGGTTVGGGTLQLGLLDGGASGAILENQGVLGSGPVSLSGNGLITFGGAPGGVQYSFSNAFSVNGGVFFAQDGGQTLASVSIGLESA